MPATTWPAAKNAGGSVSTIDWNDLVAAMRSWPAPPAEAVNANQNTLANLAALYVGNIYVSGGMDLAGKNLTNLGTLSFAPGGSISNLPNLTVGAGTAPAGININGAETAANGAFIFGKAGGVNEWLIASARSWAGGGLKGLYVGTLGAEPFAIWTANIQRVTVDGNGNAGFGTQTPGTKVDSAGTVRTTNATFATSGEGVEMFYTPAELCGYIVAYNRGTATYKKIKIDCNALLLQCTTGGPVIQAVPTGAPPDGDLWGKSMTVWYDEANSRLAFKCKTSGNVVKTGYVSVS